MVRVREFLQHTELVARSLSGCQLSARGSLDRQRQDSTAIESPSSSPGANCRHQLRPADGCAARARDGRDDAAVRRGRPYVSLDTDSVGGYVIRAAAPIEDNSTGPRVLIALYPCRCS